MHKARTRWLSILLPLLAAVLVLGMWAWVPAHTWQNEDCAITQNAAWIDVKWTSEPVDRDAVKILAQDAQAHQLRYLYPYAAYVKEDGTFSQSYTYAEEFLQTFREYNDTTQIYAWVGVPLANERSIGIQGWVDLSDIAQRQSIVDFAVMLVTDLGYDGVHLNVETVNAGDMDFLLLLEETRDALPVGTPLSVAGAYWLPDMVNHLPVVNGYRWDSDFYAEVASRVDQIAVMSYDSLMPHPALYRIWMREQVRGIAASLDDSDVELLMGISVSSEATLTHKPQVETLPNGLAGLCASDKHVDGIAVYAAWEATPEDWMIWDMWLSSR